MKSVLEFPAMKFFKEKSLLSAISVVFLLGLLVLLAGLQYKWLGQIAGAERERMQSRLQDDTRRFAEEFNRELQNVYFTFQLTAENFQKKDWDNFNQNYALWREKAKYPDLVKDFYFVKANDSGGLFQFNRESGNFENAEWTEDLQKISAKLADEKNFDPVDAENSALAAIVYEDNEDFRQIVVRRNREITNNKVPAPLELLKKYGILIIRLDEAVIKTRMLPDLAQKYFAGTGAANFNLTVVDSQKEAVFKTSDAPVSASDASAKLFEISARSFSLLGSEQLPKMPGEVKAAKSVIYSRLETKTSPASIQTHENKVFDVEVKTDSKLRIALPERNGNSTAGAWTLNVQHSDGSLEQFISNTRRRNLGISFGILSLLGASVVLILISAQRSKRLAQRQLDFVSSVSHEFRTPLAVIYSAGENLTDGVVGAPDKIAKYGNLIKGEGKKLSSMVEQILEFAGARSGKRKYDFRAANVKDVIEDALRECQPLLDEKEFLLEKEISGELPAIYADSNAMSHAIQNLIINSIKYSSGNRRLKITAQNGGGDLKITVEDRGIGISKKDLAHIFEPFYRAKAVVDEQIHGNGLGLSLVRQIVEAHKGKIKVESEIGKGSRFIIHLPLNI